MYEGLYGPKEAASSNIIEDIIEELDKERKENQGLNFSKILLDKLFGDEPKNLKSTLEQRIQSEDCDPEEKEEHSKFITKIQPIYFDAMAGNLEFDMEEKK